MNGEIKTFTDSEIFSCNIYVISSNDSVIVIDSGFYNSELKDYLKALGKVDAILLTHGHGDHIRCVDDIIKDFPDAKAYIHSGDKDLLHNSELNCSFLVGKHAIDIESDVKLLEQGNYSLGELEVRVIHVPGHTDGCVMYYFEKLGALFLGDTVMGDSVGTLRTPTGDFNKMEASLGKFKHLGIDTDTLCYPGHGEVCTYGEILRINPFLNGRF